MQFHTLKRKTPNKKSKQVGRGGTRGKTSGRGTKGQNARAGRKKRPELRDFIKRVPKLRGRGKNSNKSRQTKLSGAALKEFLASKKQKAAG
jgi:large subunit ribosomal protein L15